MTAHFFEGRFAGKVLVVTGAAQGIGRAVAERAAAEGGAVVVGDRSPLVKETAEAIVEGGGVAHAVECDLEHFEGAASLMAAAIADQVRTLEAFKTHGEYDNLPARALAEDLTTMFPVEDALAFFTSGGGDSIETVVGRGYRLREA